MLTFNYSTKEKMQVQTNITLSAAEELEISTILGCTLADLNNKLNLCITASLDEYLCMIRGQKVFKRGTDMLEYRLFLFIGTIFDGKIPDESVVSRLFQTTITESRSLIRAVMSKYQYQLKISVEKTIKECLTAAQRPNNSEPYSVVINSQNIIDELNKALGEIDGNLVSVSKRRGSVSTYEITASAYNKLCLRLAVPPNP